MIKSTESEASTVIFKFCFSGLHFFGTLPSWNEADQVIFNYRFDHKLTFKFKIDKLKIYRNKKNIYCIFYTDLSRRIVCLIFQFIIFAVHLWTSWLNNEIWSKCPTCIRFWGSENSLASKSEVGRGIDISSLCRIKLRFK